MTSDKATDAAELRRRAEVQLQSETSGPVPRPSHETQRLVHELQVYQIELEMQNEELRRSRAEVEAAAARYTDLYDFAPVGYFTLGRLGVITQANLAGARLLGIERAWLPGRRFETFVAEADQPAFNACLRGVLAGHVHPACEVELVKSEAAPRTVQIEATLSPDGRECRAVVVDITARKQAEATLRESELRLVSIVDSAMDAIITVDEAQRILVFNAAAGVMFRCSPADAIGELIERFIPQRFRAGHPEQMRAFSADGTTIRGMGRTHQVSALRTGGEEFRAEASISHVEVQGRPLFSVILRDISDRLAAEVARDALEAQLRVSQKMEAIGTLASGIAHDFNNILGAI